MIAFDAAKMRINSLHEKVACFYGAAAPDLTVKQSLASIVGVFQIQMPVIGSVWLADFPCFIECCKHLFGKWALLTVLQVLVELIKAGHTTSHDVSIAF